MARFSFVKDPESDEKLNRMYAQITESGFGEDTPINWFTAQGTRPDILEGTWGLVKNILVEGELPATLKQMIATVISKQNHCRYCEATHTGAMNLMGVSQATIESCVSDPALKDVPQPQRSVLLFSLKAAATPNELTDSDFQELRDRGLKGKRDSGSIHDGGLYEFH